MQNLPLIFFVTSALVAHLTMTAVMALFAHYKVRYLSIAWIMAIFAALIAALIPFTDEIETVRPATFHPGPMAGFMVWAYLQSIYPLSITMPGYLQWRRMVIYASPVFVILLLYGLLTLLGMTMPNYYNFSDVLDNFWTPDVMLRMLMLIVSIFYIINIFFLPKRMLRYADVPAYVYLFSFILGISSCHYLWLTIKFEVWEFELWLLVFTFANLYLCLRELETIARALPQPAMELVEEAPAVDEIDKTDHEDFNEANRQRFERLEFWMQHNREAWKDFTFGRDTLCDATGINRHLMLQALRSQGYNNVHEYINAYRIKELQRMVEHHQISTVKDCLDAGFGSLKTARSSFQRVTGLSLDDYITSHTMTD